MPPKSTWNRNFTFQTNALYIYTIEIGMLNCSLTQKKYWTYFMKAIHFDSRSYIIFLRCSFHKVQFLLNIWEEEEEKNSATQLNLTITCTRSVILLSFIVPYTMAKCHIWAKYVFKYKTTKKYIESTTIFYKVL